MKHSTDGLFTKEEVCLDSFPSLRRLLSKRLYKKIPGRKASAKRDVDNCDTPFENGQKKVYSVTGGYVFRSLAHLQLQLQLQLLQIEWVWVCVFLLYAPKVWHSCSNLIFRFQFLHNATETICLQRKTIPIDRKTFEHTKSYLNIFIHNTYNACIKFHLISFETTSKDFLR